MVAPHASTSSFAFAQSATHATAFHVSSTSPSWIIDYKASAQMTGVSPLFSLYSALALKMF